MSKPVSTRALVATALKAVVQDHKSLAEILPRLLDKAPPGQAGLLHELTAGSLRWWWPLSASIEGLLQKPLKTKDFDVYCLMLVGLYQIEHTRIPDHAAVSETVAGVKALGKPWAEKLVNAILRRYLRERGEMEARKPAGPAAKYSHPEWMVEQVRQDWPDHWQALLEANNHPPVLTLRVNTGKTSRSRLKELLAQDSIEARNTLHSPVGLITDSASRILDSEIWMQGEISIQDESAQIAGQLAQLKPGMRVLDACAAPGGKTCHLLEREPGIDLLALDLDPSRLERVQQNLDRLGLVCNVEAADATRPDAWWGGQQYELILLDAPCSGSGVIRKHPDIKHLRRPADIAQMVSVQHDLLDALWPLLRVGGKLLYFTCSVFRQENDQQSNAFLDRHSEATLVPLAQEYGLDTGFGRQRLPGRDNSDGFFYACFEKISI